MSTPVPSIIKKQIVAVTGAVWVVYLLVHLYGNFYVFGGPEALNGWAEFLRALPLILWALRIGLIVAFLVHVFFTVLLVVENLRARGTRYAKRVNHRDSTSFAVRTMPFTGPIILIYIIFHLLDFTFAEHTGIVAGEDLGLYGLVVTTFADPVHSALYVVAMLAVGLHLGHAIQSVFQTFGLCDEARLPTLGKLSVLLGALVALAYISIPVYVLVML